MDVGRNIKLIKIIKIKTETTKPLNALFTTLCYYSLSLICNRQHILQPRNAAQQPGEERVQRVLHDVQGDGVGDVVEAY